MNLLRLLRKRKTAGNILKLYSYTHFNTTYFFCNYDNGAHIELFNGKCALLLSITHQNRADRRWDIPPATTLTSRG
jgi:hypothetical protein